MPGAEAAAVSETGIKTGRFGGSFFRQHQNQSQKAPLWGCFFVWGRDRGGAAPFRSKSRQRRAYSEASLRIALGRCAPEPPRDFPPRESHQSAPGAFPGMAGSPRTPVCPKDEANRSRRRIPRRGQGGNRPVVHKPSPLGRGRPGPAQGGNLPFFRKPSPFGRSSTAQP